MEASYQSKSSSDDINTYRLWEPLKAPSQLNISSKKLDSLNLIECYCSPFSGQRKKTTQKNQGGYIGIQAIRTGKEKFKTNSKEVTLNSGSLLIWNSNIPSEFEVIESLHESTVIIPIQEINRKFHANKSCLLKTLESLEELDTNNITSKIIHNYLCTLTSNFKLFKNTEIHTIKRTVLDLTVSLLETKNEDLINSKLSRKYIRNIKKYILENIQDTDLNLKKIAIENRISVRYLHILFNETGTTPFSWLQNIRLEKCKEDLLNPAYKNKQISETCFKWGFNDPSHFSRCFKNKYGYSPKELKKRATVKW